IVAAEGQTLEIGAVICRIEAGGSGSADSSATSQPEKGKSATEVPTLHQSDSDDTTANAAHTSPVAAKILAEKGIDPRDVNGTGAGGRITKEDALNANK